MRLSMFRILSDNRICGKMVESDFSPASRCAGFEGFICTCEMLGHNVDKVQIVVEIVQRGIKEKGVTLRLKKRLLYRLAMENGGQEVET